MNGFRCARKWWDDETRCGNFFYNWSVLKWASRSFWSSISFVQTDDFFLLKSCRYFSIPTRNRCWWKYSSGDMARFKAHFLPSYYLVEIVFAFLKDWSHTGGDFLEIGIDFCTIVLQSAFAMWIKLHNEMPCRKYHIEFESVDKIVYLNAVNSEYTLHRKNRE